jgi:outer membrane protein assembly factor BamB
MKKLSFSGMLLLAVFSLFAQTVDQWRGPNRDGVYPEKDLLGQWPAEGPLLLWKADSIGNGFASPVITAERIYVPGEIDSVGYLFSYDKKGNLLWKVDLGNEWTVNFPGPRCTPTVAGDLLYYLSSMGKLHCLDAGTGKTIWTTRLTDDLHGVNVRFGYTESLLIDGDRIFCSPAGRDTNVVALNRFDGSLIWKSKAMGDSAAYCSPVLIKLPGRTILVTLAIHDLIGLDANTGELLWSQKLERWPNDIHCNVPLYENGFIYVNDRGGNGFVKLQLSPDGKTITEVWRNFKAGNVQGGFIKIGDFLYGSRYRPSRFESLSASTGEVADSLKFSHGSTIFADGLLYCYTEQGMVGLIRPDNGKAELLASFKITAGTLEHFAHPVIRDGVLYIRHGKVLLAYDIRKK